MKAVHGLRDTCAKSTRWTIPNTQFTCAIPPSYRASHVQLITVHPPQQQFGIVGTVKLPW